MVKKDNKLLHIQMLSSIFKSFAKKRDTRPILAGEIKKKRREIGETGFRYIYAVAVGFSHGNAANVARLHHSQLVKHCLERGVTSNEKENSFFFILPVPNFIGVAEKGVSRESSHYGTLGVIKVYICWADTYTH